MVNVGVIGLGELGTRHALAVMHRTPGARLAAICSRRTKTVERFTGEHGAVDHVYTDYDAMLANSELDAIMIVTPVSTHADLVIRALEAGFHVFVEKPLGLTNEEALRVEEVARTRPDQILLTGFMRRCDPSYVEAKQKVDRGDIGTPIIYRGYSLDQDASPVSAPGRESENGPWFPEMLVHDVDLARWFLGSEVETIRTIGGCYKYKEFEKFNDIDNACTLMSFAGGAMGMFYTGRTAPHGSHIETEIIGTEGTLRIDPVPSRNKVQIFDTSGVRVECVSDYLERFHEAFDAEIREFVSCVAEGRKPEMTARDARVASEVANAAYQAYVSGELIRL